MPVSTRIRPVVGDDRYSYQAGRFGPFDDRIRPKTSGCPMTVTGEDKGWEEIVA